MINQRRLAAATDYCGVRSGRDVDKFKETGLTREKADIVKAPMIKEAPVSIECRVKIEMVHIICFWHVVAVHADERYMDENNRFGLTKPDRWSSVENILAQERSWELLDTV